MQNISFISADTFYSGEPLVSVSSVQMTLTSEGLEETDNRQNSGSFFKNHMSPSFCQKKATIFLMLTASVIDNYVS